MNLELIYRIVDGAPEHGLKRWIDRPIMMTEPSQADRYRRPEIQKALDTFLKVDPGRKSTRGMGKHIATHEPG